MRSLISLGVTCVALGAFWSGVKGGGPAFGAIAGGLLFGLVLAVGYLITTMAGPSS